MYLIWLAIFGNYGFGFGNNGAAAATSGALTRAELTDGLNNQSLQSDIASISSSLNTGVDSINQSLCSGFGNTNSNINNGVNSINSSITNSAFGAQNAIHDLQSSNQMGFCSINNNIGNLKYEMAQNCCDIKNAMHSEGEATRALIQANTIQDLRDQLADKAADLQSAQLTLANANQTQNILNSLGKYVPTCNCSTSW